MGEKWYQHWQQMGKKKAKFKVTYQEPIYPAEFRVQPRFAVICPLTHFMFLSKASGTIDTTGFIPPYMPVMLTGWVQNEIHVQWGYQSLQ